MATQVPDQSKSNSLFLTIMSIMAGLQVIGGGLVLIESIPSDVSGILMLVIGAVNAGVMYYLNGNIVSLDNVVAYQPNRSTNPGLYAGGAAIEATGKEIPVDAPVGSLAGREIYPDEV